VRKARNDTDFANRPLSGRDIFTGLLYRLSFHHFCSQAKRELMALDKASQNSVQICIGNITSGEPDSENVTAP